MYISHENYNLKAEDYDKNRQPVEMDILISQIEETSKRLNKPIEEMILGDFGCGTGNYVELLLQKFNFKKVIGIEMNDGMITLFNEKFKNNSKVTLYKQSLFEMDLKGETVDVAIMNQVSHHLDTQKKNFPRISKDFPNLQKVINNVSKLIKSGGIFAINFSTPIQNIKGIWFYNHVFPQKFTTVNKYSFNIYSN